MVTKDDIYNGYFIPAGTTIIGNTWSAIVLWKNVQAAILRSVI